MPIRILLVEDHILMRQGLRALLEQEEDFEVVGEAQDGREAIEAAERLLPDIILMDIVMAGLNGLEATRIIRSRTPKANILILSMYPHEEYVQQALRNGAQGYLTKQGIKDELMLAIRSVHRGEQFLSPNISHIVIRGYLEHLDEHSESSSFEKLTTREREVLQLIGEGCSNQEIADRLVLSPKTVERHRANIMKKLHIHHTGGLVRYAIEVGLVQLSK